MSAILKYDFQNRKQLSFSEVNYLNNTKRPNFVCDNYSFPKTRGNKNKQWTHSTPVNHLFRGNDLYQIIDLIITNGKLKDHYRKPFPLSPFSKSDPVYVF